MIWYCIAAPAVLLIAGILLLTVSPKSRGAFFGYRTRRSVRSDATWSFANKLCGKLMLAAGAIQLVFLLAAYFLFPALGDAIGWLMVGSSIVLILAVILWVEFRLTNDFYAHGEPKKK